MVCSASNCQKRKQCIYYTENYFKHNPGSDWQQLIDWSRHGATGISSDENGNTYMSESWDCGDFSKTYPKFQPILEKTDYEQWKEWLNKWNVEYEEKQWNQNQKELVIKSLWSYVTIVFDLHDNFIYISGE